MAPFSILRDGTSGSATQITQIGLGNMCTKWHNFNMKCRIIPEFVTSRSICHDRDRQIDIVGCAIQNPSTSISSDEISISKSVVHRTLKKNNFHHYHPEHHQFLTEEDCQKRVLFTDESSFANTSRENRHNYHHYADQNPRLMREDDHQHRFKVNVWAGICGEYRHIPPDDLNSQWFQHDGAPAHSTLAITQIEKRKIWHIFTVQLPPLTISQSQVVHLYSSLYCIGNRRSLQHLSSKFSIYILHVD
ncbi:hypothetical protein NQ315_013471 [Exocentrus adspersus]|uniref:Uncharacterized protein n=1 Tax=Exocentrus adspersus TaxID=1586481 RepID=A0AAV8VDY4_9CUCU|nr:hypothetical protein NQ315_013471 [Exocentrus adspersus]